MKLKECSRPFCFPLSVALLLATVACQPAPAAAPASTAAKSATQPSAATPTAKPVDDQPKYGGTLTLGSLADPPNLDVHQLGTAALFNVISPVYSTLLQYDPMDNEKIVADLAERWEAAPDGKSYTFYLRKDVKWHDGKPFTSSDAKFSVERMPKYYARKKDALKPISQVDAPDPYILKLILDYPSASVPAMLALGTMPIAPKHVIEAKGDLRKDAIGSGPFKFKGYSAGVSLEVVKNPDYFVPGRPYLNGITSYIIKDKATRFAAFRTGQVKMNVPTAKVSPAEAAIIRKELPQAVVQPFKSLQAGAFFMNMTQKPWDDIRVRQAVHLATDRQAAIKAVGEGEGAIGGAMIAGEWAIPEAEMLKLPGFRQPKDADIAQAKKLLSDAGFASGFQARILSRAGYAEYLRVAEFMTSELSKIGIRGIVDAQESVIYSDRNDKGAYETSATLPNLNITDPDESVIYFGRDNRYMIKDEKMHDLFDKQVRTTDPAERKKIVLEMQYRSLEVAPYVLNLWLPVYIAFWPEVRNYKAGAGLNNNSKYQDVWLAK